MTPSPYQRALLAALAGGPRTSADLYATALRAHPRAAVRDLGRALACLFRNVWVVRAENVAQTGTSERYEGYELSTEGQRVLDVLNSRSA